MFKKTKLIWLLLPVLLLFASGCTTPASRLDSLAESHDFGRFTVKAKGFDHLVYTHNFANRSHSAKNVLHVYLEGDGTPWKYRVVIMPDPTPRDPLMLRLMAKDTAVSAYIGRPCYNGSSKGAGCEASLWTSARYSAKVVGSMAAAIRKLIENERFTEVKLIGHSGGGALAMLIAPKLDQVTQVVTIAGNLDTEAWTEHHGYLKLYTSINPSTQPDLSQRIKQWHLLGELDAVIPPSIIRPFVLSQENALGVQLEGYTHSCCWESIWEQVARAIAEGQPGAIPGSRFKLPVVQLDNQ